MVGAEVVPRADYHPTWLLAPLAGVEVSVAILCIAIALAADGVDLSFITIGTFLVAACWFVYPGVPSLSPITLKLKCDSQMIQAYFRLFL